MAEASLARPEDSAARERTRLVSIVVVTHDSSAALAATLPALMATGAEVIVVDNASRDESVRLATAAGARVVEIHVNAGYAAACNRGIEVADPSAEWIGFVNPDVRLGPRELSALLADVPENIWALSPLTVTPGGTPQADAARRAPTTRFVAAMFLGLTRSRPPAPALVDARVGRYLYVEVLSGGSMFVRESALKRAGRWDDAFFFNGEDIDLSVRIGTAGGRLAVDRTVRVAHDKAHSSTDVETEARRLENARAYVTYFQIHGSPWQTAAVAGCAFAGCVARRIILGFRDRRLSMRGARAYARLFATMFTTVMQSFRGQAPTRPAHAEFLDA
jgi:GT2 family glycosyltransferase